LPPQRNACNGKMYVVAAFMTHVMEEYTVFSVFFGALAERLSDAHYGTSLKAKVVYDL